MEQVAQVPIDNEFQAILISALRYALGRRSYLPPDTIAYIRHLLPVLHDNTLIIMESDLLMEFKRVARMAINDYPYIKEWETLYKDIKTERTKRK